MASTQYTQANRPMRLSTPLGEDVLLLQNLTYKEEMGRPFEMTLEMQSTDGKVDFSKILGKSATVSIYLPDGGTRYLNGIVRDFVQTAYENPDGLCRYRATVVPWISMLELSTNCEAYQNLTIPQIIESVFRSFNFSNYEFNLTHDYIGREFCVQYRESASAFVHRLMEFAGISYFYRHEEGKHTIVLCDSISAPAFPGVSGISYNPGKLVKHGQIDTWELKGSLQSGSVKLSDFDYCAPNTSIVGNAQDHRAGENGSHQYFDCPGEYQAYDEPDRHAAIRLGQFQCRRSVVNGSGRLEGISAGYRFELEGFPRYDQNQPYLTIAATLTITCPPFDSQQHAGEEMALRTDFLVIPAAERYFNPSITPRPRIHGAQTAVVIGPEGQDPTIPHVSPMGSIQLRFLWQVESPSSSIWVRVSQISAGNGWGSMFIPRIGNEVVVIFQEGNPDRPLVIGSVYNALQMPYASLPDNSLLSYITDDGGNIIAMYPLEGSQAVRVYSPTSSAAFVVGDNN
jgi:type VI secretion system secreted protein VgrG